MIISSNPRIFIPKDFVMKDAEQGITIVKCSLYKNQRVNERSYNQYGKELDSEYVGWDIYFEGSKAEFLDRLHLLMGDREGVLL